MDVEVLFVNMIRRHLSNMTKEERLAYLTKLLWNSKYGWGKEIIGDADCSGSVCWSLWLMGYRIRVSADHLWKNMTKGIEHHYRIGSGALAFWIRDGKAFHVGVVEHDAIIMDAGRRFRGVPATIISNGFGTAEMEFKHLDWEIVKAQSDSGRFAFGVDKELLPLLGLFDVGDSK